MKAENEELERIVYLYKDRTNFQFSSRKHFDLSFCRYCFWENPENRGKEIQLFIIYSSSDDRMSIFYRIKFNEKKFLS